LPAALFWDELDDLMQLGDAIQTKIHDTKGHSKKHEKGQKEKKYQKR
jgi:hypothetical protein